MNDSCFMSNDSCNVLEKKKKLKGEKLTPILDKRNIA